MTGKSILVLVVAAIALLVAVAATKFSSRQAAVAPAPAPAGESELREYRVFFANDLLDPEITCEKVFSVTRRTNRKDSLRVAIEDLLRGPSDSDGIAGFRTAIPEGVSLVGERVEDGVAYLEFDGTLDRTGGSCRVGMIRRQIEETAKAASGASSVTISIDGRTEDILQP